MSFLKTALAGLASGLAVLHSASAAAAAAEGHHMPRASDLKRLGIDPRGFAAIGRA